LDLTSKIDDALREDFCETKSKALSEGRRKVLKLLDENEKSRVGGEKALCREGSSGKMAQRNFYSFYRCRNLES
jgi:hypothetical protein